MLIKTFNLNEKVYISFDKYNDDNLIEVNRNNIIEILKTKGKKLFIYVPMSNNNGIIINDGVHVICKTITYQEYMLALKEEDENAYSEKLNNDDNTWEFKCECIEILQSFEKSSDKLDGISIEDLIG